MSGEGKPAAGPDATRPPLVAWNDALDAALRAGPVLTPTRRLAREIAYAVDWHRRREGAGAWPAADVVSVDAFLTRCYAEAQDAGVPGADAVLLPDDIAPFAMERAAPRADLARHVEVFAAAWRTAKLHGLASGDAALRQTENGKVYARWAQAFEALLRDEGWITSAQLPARLVRLMDGNQRWRPPPAAVVEPPVGAAPQGAAHEGEKSRMPNLTPAVRDFLTAVDCQRVELPQGTPAHVTRRLAAADSAEELSLAAVWARERLSANANARIGVVLPALGAAFPVIERRFHSLFPDAREAADYVNVSGGLALDEVPLARDALEFLACTVGADRAALRCLAQSPFLRFGLPAERLPEYADVAALAARFNAPALRRAAEALRATKQRPPWQPLMAHLLQIAGWPCAPLDSLEAQAKTRFDECLAAFAIVERVAGFGDWAAAVAGLRRLANSRLFAPRTAAAPIQVLGRAESVGLAFDHLWLAGLDQTQWPPVPEPNPLLPLAAQRRAGVAALALDEEWERARATTAAWCRAAPDVVASHADAQTPPSQLVAHFAEAPVGDVVARPSLAAHGHPWAVAKRVALEHRSDEAAGVLADSRQRGGAAVLEDQSLCPFRAWARHRLGLKEGRVLGRFPDAAERGTVVHEILAALAQRYPTRGALPNIDENAIDEAVTAALRERKRWPPLYREREARRLAALVAEWLREEAKRSDFTVCAVEQSAIVRLGGLELDLRIDRIDEVSAAPPAQGQPTAAPSAGKPAVLRLAHRPLLLIDYKTGRARRNDWMPPRPAAPQLPLYAVALAGDDGDVRGQPSGVAFALVRPEQTRLLGVGDPAAQTDLPDAAKSFHRPFADLRRDWQTALTELAQAFVAGRAAVDPLTPATCAHCHLHAFCRVDDDQP